MTEAQQKKKGCSPVVVVVVAVVGIFLGITVIAILASIAVPVYSVIQARAARTKALAQAKQIHLALAEYAIDHNGLFPTAQSDSNSAFRQLFNDRFQDERIFYVPGCAFHESLAPGQTKPDNDVGAPPDYVYGLERGENHWAYVTGLNNGSEGHLPLVADGFSHAIGQYSDNPQEIGGVWEGEAAIVIRVDGSGKMEKPDLNDLRVYERNRLYPVLATSRHYVTR
jgi:type II secretory pathway pseudopilin PulG